MPPDVRHSFFMMNSQRQMKVFRWGLLSFLSSSTYWHRKYLASSLKIMPLSTLVHFMPSKSIFALLNNWIFVSRERHLRLSLYTNLPLREKQLPLLNDWGWLQICNKPSSLLAIFVLWSMFWISLAQVWHGFWQVMRCILTWDSLLSGIGRRTGS